MHYLITGHTGFKGSWLSLMLEMQGHTVSGIALDPPDESLYNRASLASLFKHDIRLDIRNGAALKESIDMIDPEVIIHLAAQPLVRESYRIPVETFEVNVIGTLNVLEATRELSNLKAALIITTDKVYKNRGHLRGYVESDELGGDDPYSASKAAADIAAQSWMSSFAKVPIAIARAGNVIGGGDWAQDRLIPDLVNGYSTGKVPTLRYPQAIRPWQHVLDCLNGYLILVNHQISHGTTGSWNFGPDLKEMHSVGDLVNSFANVWGVQKPHWVLESAEQPHEASNLLLDSEKARKSLSWSDKLDFEKSIEWTVNWYKTNKQKSTLEITRTQIQDFFNLGQEE
jgi:CDP-glucose 4,6-dehydratase